MHGKKHTETSSTLLLHTHHLLHSTTAPISLQDHTQSADCYLRPRRHRSQDEKQCFVYCGHQPREEQPKDEAGSGLKPNSSRSTMLRSPEQSFSLPPPFDRRCSSTVSPLHLSTTHLSTSLVPFKSESLPFQRQTRSLVFTLPQLKVCFLCG